MSSNWNFKWEPDSLVISWSITTQNENETISALVEDVLAERGAFDAFLKKNTYHYWELVDIFVFTQKLSNLQDRLMRLPFQ